VERIKQSRKDRKRQTGGKIKNIIKGYIMSYIQDSWIVFFVVFLIFHLMLECTEMMESDVSDSSKIKSRIVMTDILIFLRFRRNKQNTVDKN
jgi:hypothetical protein